MEPLHHECGIVMMRLLKKPAYYRKKYGDVMYGLHRLYLMMEKQKNRGQEGAGFAAVRLTANPGEEYMYRDRALGSGAINEIFDGLAGKYSKFTKEQMSDDKFIAKNCPYIGDLYLGHLRYSAGGTKSISEVHPFLRRNNWRAKNLAMCGNFNLTNVDEVFASIVAHGQHPRKYADTHILLEQIGHRLDREVERMFTICNAEGLTGLDLTLAIEDRMDMARVLRTASPIWDGGYVMCGLTGSGEQYALRDPWGIRTAFWYMDDEIMVLASERPVIQTVLNVEASQITELLPGQALLMNKAGQMRLEQINEPKQKRACSFERIYFSRGSDVDIYRERKEMGRLLVDQILPVVDYDIEHTVISYIPNTAEVAFYGLIDGMDNFLNEKKVQMIESLGHNPDHDELEKILSMRIRSEKVAIKDIKLRTFIAEGNSRNDLAAHVYDITYGSLQPYVDNLVIIDDSIVRGTTLRQSIIKILDRLHPKKTIIVSSSPQIRYPDYYGIDMSSMDQFIAFKAALALLQEHGMQHIVDEVYQECLDLESTDENPVKKIYAPFTDEEISAKIAELLTPSSVGTEVHIIYQTVEGLHQACPEHTGDWYFTGDYPTPGGLRMLKKAFVEYLRQMGQTK